jgi:hypothetical protein
MDNASVSGVDLLGVAGVSGLYVDGLENLSVGGIEYLGVSGIEFLGTDVSGNVTGISFLGVSGVPTLQVVGQSGIIIGGTSGLSVSGTENIGVSGQSDYSSGAVSGLTMIESAVSGLADYLSAAFSDTSKANQVQVVVLGVDANNRYIPPSSTVLTDVQTTLQGLADAVVTVVAVDGSSKLVEASIAVTLGISQTAVQSDVENLSLQALISSVQNDTQSLGLLVRRAAGVNLYLSDIMNAIEAANASGDVVYVNVQITAPTNMLDAQGNLIIGAQQIIQNGKVTVQAIERQVGKTWVSLN